MKELTAHTQTTWETLRKTIRRLKELLVDACQSLPWAASITTANVLQSMHMILKVENASHSPTLQGSDGTPAAAEQSQKELSAQDGASSPTRGSVAYIGQTMHVAPSQQCMTTRDEGTSAQGTPSDRPSNPGRRTSQPPARTVQTRRTAGSTEGATTSQVRKRSRKA